MKERTKQRLIELHNLYNKENPDAPISFEEFVFFIKSTDHELYALIKDLPEILWDGFTREMDKGKSAIKFLTPDECLKELEKLFSESENETIGFDWSCLPAWINDYIAMDRSGHWYSYSVKPVKSDENNAWALAEEGIALVIQKEYIPKNYTGDWKDSVFANPNKRSYSICDF